jgi:hypothetical protein
MGAKATNPAGARPSPPGQESKCPLAAHVDAYIAALMTLRELCEKKGEETTNVPANAAERLDAFLRALPSGEGAAAEQAALEDQLRQLGVHDSFSVRKERYVSLRTPCNEDVAADFRQAQEVCAWCARWARARLSGTVQIIPHVFLGPFTAARELETMRHKGVTHVLSILDCEPAFPAEFQYLVVPIEDEESVSALPWLSFSPCARRVRAGGFGCAL